MPRSLATAVIAGNAALGCSAAAFAPAKLAASKGNEAAAAAFFMEKGAGGMFDTRNPDSFEHEDPRKSISAAPSFEEYMKNRGGFGGASAAPAPAEPAPVAASPVAAAPAADDNPIDWSTYSSGTGAAAAPAAVAPPAATAAPAADDGPIDWSTFGSAPVAPDTVDVSPQVPAAVVPTASIIGGGGESPDVATATLQASLDKSLGKIASAIPDLAPKPDLSWPLGSETIGGHEAVLEGHDAPGPANVAWISSLTVDARLSGLTIFNGPLNDVPHLVSRCTIDESGSTMTYELDFRPRAYGAYELVDADGNYPGPEKFGRKAFEYSGARNEFFGKFCDDGVKSFFESTESSFEGASPDDSPSTEFNDLTRGPCRIAVKMPLTDGNVAAVAAAQERAADYWLGWATDGSHEHKPGAPVNTQYVYDSKFRINAYSGLLPTYTALFGPEDGAKLAAADSGPLDEAYVGGGS